jgi:hypothetical protein
MRRRPGTRHIPARVQKLKAGRDSDSGPKEKPRLLQGQGLRWIPEALEVSGLTHRQSNSVPETLASPVVALSM